MHNAQRITGEGDYMAWGCQQCFSVKPDDPHMECSIAASLALPSVPMTCLILPVFSPGGSKNRSLQILPGPQFLMSVCLSPGMHTAIWPLSACRNGATKSDRELLTSYQSAPMTIAARHWKDLAWHQPAPQTPCLQLFSKSLLSSRVPYLTLPCHLCFVFFYFGGQIHSA